MKNKKYRAIFYVAKKNNKGFYNLKADKLNPAGVAQEGDFNKTVEFCNSRLGKEICGGLLLKYEIVEDKGEWL